MWDFPAEFWCCRVETFLHIDRQSPSEVLCINRPWTSLVVCMLIMFYHSWLLWSPKQDAEFFQQKHWQRLEEKNAAGIAALVQRLRTMYKHHLRASWKDGHLLVVCPLKHQIPSSGCTIQGLGGGKWSCQYQQCFCGSVSEHHSLPFAWHATSLPFAANHVCFVRFIGAKAEGPCDVADFARGGRHQIVIATLGRHWGGHHLLFNLTGYVRCL